MGWGAAAVAIKAHAEENNWDHSQHANLYHVIKKMNDHQLHTLLQSAAKLHKNFYENSIIAEAILVHLNDVDKILKKPISD